jgi:hypothetical protein
MELNKEKIKKSIAIIKLLMKKKEVSSIKDFCFIKNCK